MPSVQVLESPGASGAEQSMLGVTTLVHAAPASAAELRPPSEPPAGPPPSSPEPLGVGVPELLAPEGAAEPLWPP